MSNTFDCRAEPWSISESGFEEQATPEDSFKYLLKYAVLAPSGHNTQPWKFKVVGDGVLVYADKTRRLPVADPDDRELTMSVGAAIMNLRVAAARFGYSSSVLPTPEPGNEELLTRVELEEGGEIDQSMAGLFPMIVKRHTNRFPYDKKPLAVEDRNRLEAASSLGKASIRIVTDKEDKYAMANLIEQGDIARMSHKDFRVELASWMRGNNPKQADGLTADSLGIPSILAGMGPWMMKTFNMGKSQGKKDAALSEDSAAMVMVLSEDDPGDLLDAGQLFEMFVLTATSMGLQYSFFNLPVEVPELRADLQKLLEVEQQPQLLFRIGYGEYAKKPAPRCRLESVLI